MWNFLREGKKKGKRVRKEEKIEGKDVPKGGEGGGREPIFIISHGDSWTSRKLSARAKRRNWRRREGREKENRFSSRSLRFVGWGEVAREYLNEKG